MKQSEVDPPGPRGDRCVSEFVLHGTVLIKDFSVFEQEIEHDNRCLNIYLVTIVPMRLQLYEV